MKSIKEKAIEMYPEHCNAYTNSGNERKRFGFYTGANYVLDVIEEFIEHNLVYEGNLKRLIEQLKKWLQGITFATTTKQQWRIVWAR